MVTQLARRRHDVHTQDRTSGHAERDRDQYSVCGKEHYINRRAKGPAVVESVNAHGSLTLRKKGCQRTIYEIPSLDSMTI